MPWHSKSNPPENFHTTEYKLTVDAYKNVVTSFISALDLDKPVVMGCSMGGRIVCHLAQIVTVPCNDRIELLIVTLL